MPDGNGVPGMQPSLTASAVAAGDPTILIRTVLEGPAQVLPASRTKYAVQMPPFAAAMNDADLAETLTFVRRAFAKGASAVTPAQVASLRAR
jgi:nitrite reductase (NO-forming)